MRNGAFPGLCRARDLLRETVDRRLTIEEIAREAAMSPFHFIRQFQAMFGETPHQFRINARLDKAKQLLALSDYSVTDVCMEVGFSSLGSFSDLFARRVGVAPSIYRRQVRLLMPVPRTLPKELIPGCLSLMAAAFAIFEKQKNGRLSDSEQQPWGDPPGISRARTHEDQAHQHHGRQSGQSVEVLYGDLRLRQEARDSRW
jgi:AraC-like DNA-binding protein